MKPAITLQIQAVLYKNDRTSLERSLSSLANAVAFAATKDHPIHAMLLWGDASPTPLYKEEEIALLEASIKATHPTVDFALAYQFFNENTGYGKGHNRLFATASAERLLILNPDVQVAHDFFLEMLPPLEDPTVGLTEARQTPVEHPKPYDTTTGETPWASGACFLMPSALYRALGGFDESFFMYCEDVDFSLRIRQQNKRLLYRPTAPVYHGKHFDGEDGSLERTETEKRFSILSQFLLAYKWRQKRMLSFLRSVCRNGDDYQRAALAAFEERLKKGELTTVEGDVKVFERGLLKNRYTY